MRACAVVLALWIVSGIGVDGVLAQEGPDVDAVRRAFAQAEASVEGIGEELWGRPLYGPTIVVDRATRRAVANGPDAAGSFEESDGVWVGTLPDDLPVANTGIDWGGRRWTMLVWPLPFSKYERDRLMAHEMFHRFQHEIGLPANNPPNDHLDAADARLWLRLEWRALREALLSEGAAREAAVADALAFRARRHALYGDGAFQEIALETNEGLAEYTGFRGSGLPAFAQRARAAFQLDEHDARARGESVVRSFAYASGPAYGLLLDDADPDWREGLEATTDLGARLAAAYGAPYRDEPEGVVERAEPYGHGPLREAEEARERERHARQAGYRARFVEGPVLTLPATGTIRYSFDPNRIEPFGEGGQVFEILEARDAWGVLKVEAGGAWVIREDGRVARVVVSAPTDPGAATGEGWTLELEEGWSLQRVDGSDDWRVVPAAE